MSQGSDGRSVFGGVDQERVLSAFAVATDDGLESEFFEAASQAAAPGADGRTWGRDPELRRAFILQGPEGLA